MTDESRPSERRPSQSPDHESDERHEYGGGKRSPGFSEPDRDEERDDDIERDRDSE